MSKRPHKDAGLAMEAATKLNDSEIASLAKEAAEAAKTSFGWQTTWTTVRIDQVEPGRLSLSVRGPGGSPVMLAFVLEATRPAAHPYEDRAAVRTQITSYQTRQPQLLPGIPSGPRRMTGQPTYQKFLREFCGRLRQADPVAVIVPRCADGG